MASIGSGDGYGDGSGYGDGYGYGDGDGSGAGYGSGAGHGAGYGSYGSGYGDGDGYWLSVFQSTVSRWSESQRERLEELRTKAAAIAFWKSDKYGRPSNGGDASKTQNAAPGVIHKTEGPLALCNSGTLHATVNPDKWRGDRLWVVALFGEVKQDEDKLGALEREIIGEVL